MVNVFELEPPCVHVPVIACTIWAALGQSVQTMATELLERYLTPVEDELVRKNVHIHAYYLEPHM